MTKKKESESVAATAVKSIIQTIEAEVHDLSDDDYLEVLDEIESWCNGGSTAKREELGRD